MNIRFVFIILFIGLTLSTVNNKKTSMSFSRRRQADELFRRSTRQCEQKELCRKIFPITSIKTGSLTQQQNELAEIEMINCVRRCISYLCYKNIYEKDPLERGEIDSRSNDFKSCWIKEQKM